MKGNDYMKDLSRQISKLEDRFAQLCALVEGNNRALAEAVERIDELEGLVWDGDMDDDDSDYSYPSIDLFEGE